MGAGGFPTEVWSLSGGWYCDPKNWKRNTAFAFLGIAAVAVPIFMTSARLETRPFAPNKPILSTRWESPANVGATYQPQSE